MIGVPPPVAWPMNVIPIINIINARKAILISLVPNLKILAGTDAFVEFKQYPAIERYCGGFLWRMERWGFLQFQSWRGKL